MRPIDADAVIAQYNERIVKAHTDYSEGVRDVLNDIESAPTIDAVEVVRCKDCEYWTSAEDYDCEIHSGAFGANDFCSYGERKIYGD